MLRVFDSPAAIGEHLAEELLGRIERVRAAGEHFLIGCPTGRTPRPLYDSLARKIAAARQDMSHVILVMMDEYVTESGGAFQAAPSDASWSCNHFAQAEMVERWNGGLPGEKRIEQENVRFPDPQDPSAYDDKISDAGGIDFFILASGASDGHVGFNPPGSPRQSRTRIIELPESTRKDNLQTFPAFGSLASVPTHGISVGIATIAATKEAAMLLWGKGKARSLARIVATSHYDPAWPATVIHECPQARILSDADAATNQ